MSEKSEGKKKEIRQDAELFADTDNRSGLLTLPNSATHSSCFRRVSDSESVATEYQLARMRHPLSLFLSRGRK